MSLFSLHKENINKIIEISMDAGRVIMGIYKTDFHIENKEDRSPLTKADIASHEVIFRSLRKLTPNIPVLSEESSRIPLSERIRWKEYWLVDPLDGTKEFIKRNGEFTTNIALIRNNRPIFGAIHAPAKGETYWGTQEDGSYYMNGNSSSDVQIIRVSENTNNKLKIVSSRSHPSPILNSLINKIDDYELVTIGSSLKFCLVAKGDADFYPRLGPTSEWDIAAGEAIVKYAGGCIYTLEGELINYNLKNTYINPSFFVCKNEHLWKEMVPKIAKD